MAGKGILCRYILTRLSKSRLCRPLMQAVRHLNVDYKPDYNSFCSRSHHCGELRRSHVDSHVVICGWVEYQRMGQFLTLRDAHGATQVIIPQEKNTDMSTVLQDLQRESVLQVEGKVIPRPDGQANPKMATGEIEIVANSLKVLSQCTPDLPFHIHEFHKITEPLRMEYRYLDLRSKQMQRNLRLRSQMMMKMREFLCNQNGFVDVETPTLFRRTPGGAREFVVPTHNPGKFYTLPQSPQQFKQLLMVGGIDRYMQIARCYRDENAKPDRQPEFTQIDLEMSFVSSDDIKQLVEAMMVHSWPEDLVKPHTPFPRLRYTDAINQYGSDKPDTRFAMKLHDISHLVRDCGVSTLCEAAGKHPEQSVQAICFKKAGLVLSNKDLDSLKKFAKQLAPDMWTASIRVKPDGSWQSSLTKSLGSQCQDNIKKQLSSEPGDLIIFTAGQHVDACCVLGKLRVEIANLITGKGEVVEGQSSDKMNILWVEDFPLFLPKEDGSEGLESAHHPFTAPHPEDNELMFTHPEKVRSQHYDLVLNGNEIGGGSIRIHNSSLQRHILNHILKEETSSLEHLLQALDFGAPPHGGIALGLDRLMAILCGTQSIRDVIAFPKSSEGRDPMSKAPAAITREEEQYYHLGNHQITSA